VLLRSARATALDAPDEKTFRDLVFQDDRGELDRRLSVYQIADEGRLTQVAAEHYAQNNRRPSGANFFDMSGLGNATPDPIIGPGRVFAFVSDAHHEIRNDNDEGVSQMATQLFALRAARSRRVDKPSMLAYVRDRRNAQDAEWVPFCAAPGRAPWNKEP